MPNDAVATVPPDNLRVSGAERDAVIEDLRQHTADGRLTLDEFGDRTNEVLEARTRAELDHTLRELPRQRRRRPAPDRTGFDWHRIPIPMVLLALAAVVAIATGAWWVIFPLLWFGCGAGRGRHRTRSADRYQA